MFQKTRHFQPFPPPSDVAQSRFDFKRLVTAVPAHESVNLYAETRPYNPSSSEALKAPPTESETE